MSMIIMKSCNIAKDTEHALF